MYYHYELKQKHDAHVFGGFCQIFLVYQYKTVNCVSSQFICVQSEINPHLVSYWDFFSGKLINFNKSIYLFIYDALNTCSD